MTAFTTNLRLTQPALTATGWGTTVNNGITALVDVAVSGSETVDITLGDVAMTIDDGASGANDARNMFIVVDGTLTANRTVTVPVNNKLYFVHNDTSGAYTLSFEATTGVIIPQGKKVPLYSDGTDILYAFDHLGSLTLDTALGAVSGGTGQSSYTIGDLLYASGTTALSKLAAAAVGNVLRAKGTGTAPAWEKVDLTTDVTGVLPSGNVSFPDATDSVKGVVELATDAEVQTGTDTTRVITPASLRGGALVLGTAKLPTSGVSVSFTGIPSWVKRVTITLYYVNLSGSDSLIAKVYTSGGVQATGYVSGTTNSKSTGVNTEFANSFLVLEPINAAAASTIRYGSIVFEKVDTGQWVYKSTIYGYLDAAVSVAAGGFALGDALGRIDITSYNGVVTFVSGSRLNILYE